MPAKVRIELLTRNLFAAQQRKERVALFRTGGFTAKRMRDRMRRGGKSNIVSKPGEYPRHHGIGRQGLRATRFDVDLQRATVIAGVIKGSQTPPRNTISRSRNGVIRRSSRPVGKTVPELVNEGGTSILGIVLENGTVEEFAVHYQPRPYTALTQPAAEDFFLKVTSDRETPLR